MRRLLLTAAGVALVAWWNKRIEAAEVETRRRVRQDEAAKRRSRQLQGHGGRGRTDTAPTFPQQVQGNGGQFA